MKKKITAALLSVILTFCLLLGGCGQNASSGSSGAAGQSAGASPASGSSSESAAGADTAGVSDAETPVSSSAGSTGAAPASAAADASGSTAAADASESTAAAAESISPAVEDVEFSAEGKGLVIVLDPGHAEQVPGTQEPLGPGSSEMKDADTVGTFGPSSGLHEYELAMQVSRKLRMELESRGYKVRLTHLDTTNPISCVQRAEVANENNADAYIRIHANGSENTEANGAMTICITKDNPFHPELYSASRRLSDILLDTYCEQTGAQKEEVWETDTMSGNNWAEMPTTLIELGYMTNPDEDLKMAQDSYQKKMVLAIADGLDLWFAQMPEEELYMHPALTEDSSEEGETASTAAAADVSGAGSTDAGSFSGETDTDSTAAAADVSDTGSTDAGDSSGEADTASTAAAADMSGAGSTTAGDFSE